MRYGALGGAAKALRFMGVCGTALVIGLGQNSLAMDLKTAVEIALETNPEIGEASANRRAIGFEYQQAKQLGNPNVILEGRAGPEIVDSRNTRLFGTDDEFLFGRQASVTLQQNLYSFGRHDAEQDRQAARTDSAAHRVWERTEFVGLDVAQAYFDIMRLREILNYADKNVAFHQKMADDLSRGASSGVIRETDSLQAQERLSSARISRNEIEENHDIAQSKFLQLVGSEIGVTSSPPTLTAVTPKSLSGALAEARKNNPTLKIAYADLDVARAEYRGAKAEGKPELMFEVGGRTSDNINGFRETAHDLRAQVVLRYEFRGGIRKSAVQEHLNWIDEQRQRVMTIERNVENLTREAWITKTRTQARVIDLQERANSGAKLISDYQREFGLGNRSLLDILNAQEDLFQSQSALITAQSADKYANYRLLAATGQLLAAMGLEPRREAKAKLRDIENVPPTPAAETEKRYNPKHYKEAVDDVVWSNTLNRRIADSAASPVSVVSNNDLNKVEKLWAKTDITTSQPAEKTKQSSEQAVTKKVALEPSPASAPAQQVSRPTAPDTSNVPQVAELPSVDISVAKKAGYFVEPAVNVEPNVQYIEAVPISHVKLETIPTEARSLPAVQTPVQEASNIASEDSFPIGVPIVRVDLTEYEELKSRSGAIQYPKMKAILVDDLLYLLKT